MANQNIIDNLLYNKIEILFPDGEEKAITDDNISSESMKLRQSICDESYLKFGGCISSEFRIDLINTEDRQFTDKLAGKWINVRITHVYVVENSPLYPSKTLCPSKNLYPGNVISEYTSIIFSGYIYSAKCSPKDKNIRTIIAYDVMSKLYEWDATNALTQLWNSSSATISSLYRMCLKNNGNMIIPDVPRNDIFADEDLEGNQVGFFKTQNTDWINNSNKISYGELLRQICEILGVFGFIQPSLAKGTFKLIALSDFKTAEIYDFYEELNLEEYSCTGYTSVCVPLRDTSGNGKSYTAQLARAYETGAVDKVYDLSDNILAWRSGLPYTAGHGMEIYLNSGVGDRLSLNANGARFTVFQPIKAKLDARLWADLGKPITIKTSKTNIDGSYVLDEGGNIIKENVNSYILTRTLSGIQALTDEIEAKGLM